MNRNNILNGIFGVCVGDALGVAVEFSPRSALKETPVTDMIGNRTPHYQTPGTWSDDSSLMLCLVESLCSGLDLQDIADRICKLLDAGKHVEPTPRFIGVRDESTPSLPSPFPATPETGKGESCCSCCFTTMNCGVGST